MDQRKPIIKRKSTFLPHWEKDGATYSVTFRLADSLPVEAAEKLAKERRALEREWRATGKLEAAEDHERLYKLHTDEIERLLNNCVGECVLRRDDCAKIVADALRHFHGDRYEMLAWCVMPNHVHVVFRPLEGWGLEKLMKSWKSFSARAINALLGREGTLWQSEYYDHLIRTNHGLTGAIEYVLDNPVKAHLAGWKWVWAAENWKLRTLE